MSRLVLLLAILAALGAASAPASASVADSLDIARQKIMEADYKDAIQILDGQLDRLRPDPVRLRQAYLLRIMADVLLSNSHRARGDTPSAKYAMENARNKVLECLRIKELRHTQPVIAGMEAADVPPAMVNLFREARQQIFGAFRITTLSPPNAVAILDGDTLSTLPGSDAIGDYDLALGPHIVVLQAPGYQTMTENIDIEPGVTVDRELYLKHRKGTWWYLTRGGIAAAAFGGGIFGLTSGGGTHAASPLPGPPAPPH